MTSESIEGGFISRTGFYFEKYGVRRTGDGRCPVDQDRDPPDVGSHFLRADSGAINGRCIRDGWLALAALRNAVVRPDTYAGLGK